MDRQPHLPLPNPHGDPPPEAPRTSRGTPHPAPRALVRTEAVIRVLVRVYLGVLVAILPWLSLWTQNNLFTYSPLLMSITGSGFFRGMVSGLGLLNVMLALARLRDVRIFR